MNNNWNEERIPRKANSIQWTGKKNTQEVLARLTQHKMIGELYRDIHIQVYRGGSYDDTINIGMWLVVGEDSKLRIYTDDQHELMYRPIDYLPDRLKAFALEILDRDSKRDIENFELELMGIKHGLIDQRGDLVSFLKAQE